MKKRLAHLLILGIAALSLTACQDFLDMFYFGGETGYTSRPDKSIPPAGDTAAHAASYTYKDYVLNNAANISSTPSTGTTKLLVIPVWFNDSDAFIAEESKDLVREDIQTAYFGTNEETGWRSVKSYYEEESHDTLTINGNVSEWYSVSRSYNYYAVDNSGLNDSPTRTPALAKEVTNWYFTNHTDENRQDYDSDNDGYLDGIMLIYAAPDYGPGGFNDKNKSNLWAYCYWVTETSEKSLTNPGVNAFFWASYDFMYNQSKARARTGKSTTKYASGDVSHMNSGQGVDAHTYIHEMGHMFGLEDYYDYSSNEYSPAAGFSMQDQNVGGHDPFSSFALGWGKAYVPIETTDINIKPFATSGEMIILSPSWNEYNSPFDEYLILEYYTTDGLNQFDTTYRYQNKYPTGSPNKGIRVWHVDARLVYSTSGNFDSSRMTTNPSINFQKVTLAMSNTYKAAGVSSGYLSPLAGEGDKYCNYNLLQLIKANGGNYKNKNTLSYNMLFTDTVGKNEFDMSNDSIKNQFVETGQLNKGVDLGFTFKVNALNSDVASISVTKI